MPLLLLSHPSPEREAIQGALRTAGQEVVTSDTAATATARLARPGIDLVVLDLAASDAIRFLRRHAATRKHIPVVCVADRRKAHAAAEALRLGIVDILQRPVREDDLATALANAGEFVRLSEDAPALPPVDEIPGGLFGASHAMRDILDIVGRVAQSRCAVLIVGERGTGRETIARAIHAQGPRREREFVKIVCADLTAAQLESTLARAHECATVYLENVSELPLDLQSGLEARVATQESAPGDARFIASSHPAIDAWTERGLVRAELVEAVSVVRIDVPPLRQRPEDVALLATHFLKAACGSNDVPPKAFSRSALALLAGLPWAGNAGELRSLAERLAVLVPRGVVLLEDVLANVRFDGAHAIGRAQGTLKEARDRFERDYVTAVLQHHKGRMGAAARELGIERTNLYRKIRQLHISWTIPE